MFLPFPHMTHLFQDNFETCINVYLMKLISAISEHFHFCPFLFVLSLYLQLLLDLKGPPSIPHLQKVIELLEVNQFY